MLNARRYTILHDPQWVRLAILLPTVDNSENEFTQFDGSVGENEISNNKSFDQFSKWQLDDGLSLFSIFFLALTSSERWCRLFFVPIHAL